MAFFPNFLKERYRLCKQAELRAPFRDDQIPPIKEILEVFRKNNNTWIPYLFLAECDLNLERGIICEESYQICVNKQLRDTLEWISRRVLTTIGIDNYLSIGVYTRIGTSMINKLVYQGVITKGDGMYYHDNLVRNAADLLSAITEEDLPF